MGGVLGPLLVTVALLGAVEAVLRLVGFEVKIALGGTPHANLVPLFQPATGSDGTPLWQRKDAPVAFRREKLSNGLRVFVLGESSVLGWPFGPDFAFPRFLGDHLATAFPDRVVEVVNCGVNAVGSWNVRRILEEEVVRYAPDVVIVYTGHNDWWHPRPVEVPRLVRRLAGLRLVQLAAATNARWRRSPDGAFDPRREKALQDSFGYARQRARGELTLSRAESDEIVRRFADHLRAIVHSAQRAGASVVLGTLAQNLRDFPPGASRHREGLSPTASARWTALVEHADTATRAGDCRAALDALDHALRIDRRPALVYHARARCLETLGRYGRARASYRIASDRDEVPMGTRSILNVTIREVAAETGARLVDVPGALTRVSRHGLIGREWFYDHLHPTFAGHVAIARAFASALGAPGGSWPDGNAIEAAHPDLVKQAHVATILAYLMLGWYDAADRELDDEVRRFPDLAAIPDTIARAHAVIAKFRLDDPAPSQFDLPEAPD